MVSLETVIISIILVNFTTTPTLKIKIFKVGVVAR
jgi:hypothetical protein